MAKFKERLEALRLRRKGWSIGDIARKVEVSKGTCSLWCRDIVLTKKQIDKLWRKDMEGAYLGRLKAAENRREERMERMKSYAKQGKMDVAKISERELFILGVGLYWSEGDKKSRQMVFANSDPGMILVWLRWLKTIFNVGVDGVSCYVGINELHEQRVPEVEKYWSEITGIPRDRFTKASLKRVANKKIYPNSDKHYGTLFVRTLKSTNLNYRIMGMIEAVSEQFMATRDKI